MKSSISNHSYIITRRFAGISGARLFTWFKLLRSRTCGSSTL